jgi:hypothetical protein
MMPGGVWHVAGKRADCRHVWRGARARGEGVLGVQRRVVQGSLDQRVLHAMRCLSPTPCLTLPPKLPCTMPLMPMHTPALSRMPSWLDATVAGQHSMPAPRRAGIATPLLSIALTALA